MKRIAWILLLIAGLGAGAALAQDRHEHPAGHGAAPEASAPAGDDFEELEGLSMEAIEQSGTVREIPPGTVHVPLERQQLIGVRFGTVDRRPLRKHFRTVGRIDTDERRVGIVSPKIPGWIETLNVDFTGRFVRRGEPLLTLYSPELVSAQEEYLLALEARNTWSGSPVAEVSRGGRLLSESARRRLKLWDISDAQIRALEARGEPAKTLTLYSPFTGHVLEKTVSRGQFVEAGMTLFRIADLSVVWLIAEIYEPELPFIQPGQTASLRIAEAPGAAFTGKITYIYPDIDPRTRTARARVELANPGGRLKPGMFATVEIDASMGEGLAVEEGAVIDTGTRKLVFVDRGSGYLEPREIRTGVRAGAFFEVTEGLAAGERVVTSANFLIDSESKLKEAVGGGHQH